MNSSSATPSSSSSSFEDEEVRAYLTQPVLQLTTRTCQTETFDSFETLWCSMRLLQRNPRKWQRAYQVQRGLSVWRPWVAHHSPILSHRLSSSRIACRTSSKVRCSRAAHRASRTSKYVGQLGRPNVTLMSAAGSSSSSVDGQVTSRDQLAKSSQRPRLPTSIRLNPPKPPVGGSTVKKIILPPVSSHPGYTCRRLTPTSHQAGGVTAPYQTQVMRMNPAMPLITTLGQGVL